MYAFQAPALRTSACLAGSICHASVCKRPRVGVGRRLGVSTARMQSKGPLQLARDAQRVYSADKPPWCQPWTIVSTGAGAVSGSWYLFRGWTSVLAVGVTAGVLIWWYLFLVLYPQDALRE